MFGIKHTNSNEIVVCRSTRAFVNELDGNGDVIEATREIPDDCEAVERDVLEPKATIIDGVYAPPPEPEPPIVEETLAALLAIDAENETGTLQTIVKFLQTQNS